MIILFLFRRVVRQDKSKQRQGGRYEMVKRIFLLGFILCNICFCITAGAAQIEDYGRYNMRVRPDRAVSGPPFQTSLGELRIEFTNNTNL